MSEQQTQTQTPVADPTQDPAYLAAKARLHAEGVYRGTVLRHSFELSTTGTPSVKLIVRWEDKEDETDLEFRKLPNQFTYPLSIWLSEKALDGAKQNLTWLGFDCKGKFARLVPNGKPDAADFTGHEIFAVCRHGEFKGRPKADWFMQRRAKAGDYADLEAAAAALDGLGGDGEAEDVLDQSF